MVRNEKDGVMFYTFNKFKNLRHGFSTKHGGVSKGDYSTMNLSFTRGDNKEDVMENFRRMGKAVGFSIDNIVFSDQSHGIIVQEVGQSDRGKGITLEKEMRDVDGIITRDKNVVLTTFYADCVPLFFYDYENNAIGLSHAGWKGTLNKIGAETVKAMVSRFGSRPENIIAGIGPSIHKCCFEVDKDVADLFLSKYVKESETDKNKYYVDLQGFNVEVLLESGIKEENIELSNICTKCNHTEFYSHRKHGSKRGSLAAFLSLDNGDGK